jgi:hypothetical protein
MKRHAVSKPLFTLVPRIHICPCSGQILFATEQIASCVFCCTKQVLLQKTLAPQGGTHPPKSVAFGNHLGGDWMGGTDATRRFMPLKIRRMNGNENNTPGKGKGGRTPKNDPASFRYSVNFTAVEHARFLTMFEQSGVKSKASFIAARVFSDEFRVVKIDRSAMEYVTKLTAFYAQFRSVGVNYNQVVKELHSNFSEKKALALLYKLEKATVELAEIGKKILELSEEFKQRWLQK